MTQWFSDHLSLPGTTAGFGGITVNTLPDPLPVVSSAGVGHGRIRYKRATITGLPLVTTPDVLRFFSMRSGDRLFELLLSSDGGSTAGAVHIGIYLAGTNHDGAVVDADLFASAQTISTALDRTDVWTESTTLDGTDRGKALWEQAAVGAGTDTSDPDVVYDICATVSTSFTVADSELVLEAYYTSGD